MSVPASPACSRSRQQPLQSIPYGQPSSARSSSSRCAGAASKSSRDGRGRGIEAIPQTGSAYGQMQATRPQTIGYALADSPAGQASWIYDIFDSGSGRTGHPESVLQRDRRLEITMYWLTDTAGSSARFYFEEAHRLGKHNNGPGRPAGCGQRLSKRPAASAQMAARVYPKLYYWHEVDHGGHFAPMEVPDLFIDELRRGFRPIRTTLR